MEEEVFFGEVIWFNVECGYGFISWEKDEIKQDDMFCYYTDINQDGFKQLKAQEKVSFELGSNNSGKPKAVNITIL